MYEDPGMVGFRKVTFSSSGIETLMSSCNLIQTGLLAITINKLIALSFTIKLTSL